MLTANRVARTGPSALSCAPTLRDREDVAGVAEAVRVQITRRIPVPAAQVHARLDDDPAAFLDAPDDLLPLSMRFAGVRFDRTAVVGFAPVVEEEDGTRILPLWWEAAEQPWLFPTFDGGLEVHPHDGGAVLRLAGHYRPPLGAAGRLVNRAVLNRAATASLEALLDRLASRLTADPGRWVPA